MDYEKKYKKALEHIKECVPDENGFITIYPQEIFPELKESDDEKISKEIISYIKNSTVCIDTDTFKKWIAWLEKQGEQKPYASETMNEKRDFDSGFTKMMENEQKSTWTEEDEKYTNIVVSALCSPSAEGLYSFHNVKSNDVVSWFMLLKNRVQPKQEWSEEDKMMLQYAIEHFERQKRNCIEGGGRKKVMQEFIDWLKSLRPQNTWKPSDKQMEALKEACDEHWEPDGLDPLYTLYQDLKKLKG